MMDLNTESEFDGIIFDIDGTIWDTTETAALAYNQAIKESGVDKTVTADMLKGLFGLPMKEIFERLLPNVSEDVRDEIDRRTMELEVGVLNEFGGIPYEGLKDAFTALARKYPLFIVSNCQEGYIELTTRLTGIAPYITEGICPDDTGMLKADNISYIAKKYGLKHPIYVGDTQMDANACKEAGVPIIFCSFGFGNVENPDYVVDSYAELLYMLL